MYAYEQFRMETDTKWFLILEMKIITNFGVGKLKLHVQRMSILFGAQYENFNLRLFAKN